VPLLLLVVVVAPPLEELEEVEAADVCEPALTSVRSAYGEWRFRGVADTGELFD
jgi:hypothetical protein